MTQHEREAIIQALLADHDDLGTVPGRSTFLRRHPEFRRSHFEGGIWARWSDAVDEAGLEPRKRTERFDHDFVMRAFADAAISLGRIPTNSDLRLLRRQQGLSVNANLFTRFGSRQELLGMVLEWCSRNRGYDAVAVMCRERAPIDAAPVSGGDTVAGYVYLLRSSTRGHKIGMTTSMPRRWSEIESADPGDVELVHHFKTIDARGIEAYWHQRFAARRRARGEWFELTAADVAEFKRRSKSM